ncbi:MAG TPA: hypothetical protein VMF11_04290 [Candidatus Baltobacteraceae bacterium]|nr:hypothetical protein [Candidatus Baltobacteraceae bacterium]
MQYTYFTAIEAEYAMDSSYVLTNAFETGAEIYDDLEAFVNRAKEVLDDESI